jgi:hypothetical protein
MDSAAVADHVERCRQLTEASPQMDEENTKVRLVQPFLELLGWDLYSTEVELEYTVPMGSSSTRVDYALLVGDSPVVFVEAKAVGSTLTDENVQQLRSYMRQELEVDWGILTNGVEFDVLTKNYHETDGEEVSVAQFDLDDLAANPDVLDLLTKESIRSGKSDEVAEQVARTNRAIRRLEANEDAVATAVAEAVEDRVGELTVDTADHAREFVQTLVSTLRERREVVGGDPFSEVGGESEAGEASDGGMSAEASDGSKTDTDGHEPPERETETESETETENETETESETEAGSEAESDGDSGYVVEFSDGGRVPPVDDDPPTQQKISMGEAVDYLITEHDLSEVLDLPYSTPRAQKNCLINTEPEHPDGRQMRGFYTLVNDDYLYTSHSLEDKRRLIEHLAGKVDLSVEFAGEW